jgi:hypothetical protein
MISKRSVLPSVVVVLAALALIVPQILDARSGGLRCRLDGTWVWKGDDGTVATVTFVPAGPENNLVSIAVDVVNFDSSLSGIFPDISLLQNMVVRGDLIRTGANTFQYSWIVYGRTAAREIVWIMTTDGGIEVLDPNTYDDTVTINVFSAREQESPVLGPLPDQDVDGDGLPDPDQDPLLSIPMHGVGQRLPPLGG